MHYYFIHDSEDNGGRQKNVVRVKNGLYSHFQIEQKNGMTFMRFKRRRIQ